jgi:hypothetical protein
MNVYNLETLFQNVDFCVVSDNNMYFCFKDGVIKMSTFPADISIPELPDAIKDTLIKILFKKKRRDEKGNETKQE